MVGDRDEGLRYIRVQYLQYVVVEVDIFIDVHLRLKTATLL